MAACYIVWRHKTGLSIFGGFCSVVVGVETPDACVCLCVKSCRLSWAAASTGSVSSVVYVPR